MGLDSLLKPSEWDEKILKQYTRLTKRWEDKGKSRYSLASILNMSGVVSYLASVVAYPLPVLSNLRLPAGIIVSSQVVDEYRNSNEREHNNDITDDGTTTEPSRFLRAYKNIAKFTRLPLMLYGLGHIGKAVIELANYVKTNNQESLNTGICDLFFGYSFISNSSSMYIKASDPKMLQKDKAKASQPIYITQKNLVPQTVIPDRKR